MAKAVTYEQAAGRKDKAERFLRDVVEDDERADEVAEESVEDYAERRGISIINPQRERGTKVATKKEKESPDVWARLRDLENEKRELEEENTQLQERLDSIVNIAAPDEEEGDEEDSDEADDEGDDDEAEEEGDEEDEE